MEIERTLNNWTDNPPLTLMIDYVRVRFATHDHEKLITELLGLDVERMQFIDHAFYGYSAMYVFGHTQVMVSSDIDTRRGTLIELKGQGCRQFECMLLGRNETWYDFLAKVIDFKGIF